METFGIAIREALSCGIPVVCTKSGGADEILSDDVGILTEHNIESLSKAMARLLVDVNKYQPKVLHEYVNNRYSSKVIANKLTELYLSVLAHGHSQ